MDIFQTLFKSLLIVLILSSVASAQLIGGTTYNPWTGELDKTLDASGSLLEGLYVDVSGDTMTGDLNINGNKYILDADGDSYIWHDGSGVVQLYADGILQVQWPIAAQEYYLLLDDGVGGFQLLLDDGVGGYFLIIK